MQPAALSINGRKAVIRLYQSGLSAQQVAEKMNVGLGAVYYSLRRFNIPRRSSKESNQLVFESRPLSYKIKTRLTPEEECLKLAALMVYWAEGYKIGTSIDFANSDPAMALLFRKFLSRICGVDEARIRCKLYCYEGQNIDDLLKYWSNLLEIERMNFTRPFVVKSVPGPRGPRMVHGLIHVCYSDKRLLRQILSWIDEYSQEMRRW